MRLPAVFTAPADVLAGAALGCWAGGEVGPTLSALVLASAAVYCAGMAANDLFDAEIDALERPGRPIPSGRISKTRAWALVGALQAVGLALGAAVGAGAALAVAGTIAGTYLYNGWAKSRRWVGPVAMGACRYGNACIGLAGVGAGAHWLPWAAPLSTLVFTAAVTWLSRFEAAGATPAQVRAPLWSLRAAALAPAVWLVAGGWPAPWAAALAVGTLAWLWRPTGRALRAPDPGTVRGAVMAGIYGVALSGAVLTAMAGAGWLAAVTAGLLVPGRLFGRWFYAT